MDISKPYIETRKNFLMARSHLERNHLGNLIGAEYFAEAAALLVHLSAALDAEKEKVAKLFAAMGRQCANMAFILDKAGLPDQWHTKFSRELQEDGACLTQPAPDRREALYPQEALHEGARIMLDEARRIAFQVGSELKAAPDREKMLGMYGANQVWHRLFNVSIPDLFREK